MIQVATTFVVGAGANTVYGLPLGSELRNQAISLSDRGEAFDLVRHLASPDGAMISGFISRLRQHPTTTIDDFMLTVRDNEQLIKIGRTVIAVLMASAVSSIDKKRVDPKDDWLAVIFERMRRGASNFREFLDGNTEVRFVTFNFDSVIEDRLHAFVDSYCGVPDRNALFDAIQVVHVHGRLPAQPPGPVRFTRDWVEWLPVAAESIKVIHDPIQDDELKSARRAVRDADVCVFLGMAYHAENLSRLMLPKLLVGRGGQLFGTSYKLPAVDVHHTGALMKNRITFSPNKCADALQEFAWWKYPTRSRFIKRIVEDDPLA